MIRKLYDWVMGLAAHPRAGLALFAIAFVESSFFPIPPHAMLIPMVLANRERWLVYAAVATVGSVLGGLFGYVIGAFLFDSVGAPVLSAYGAMEKFETFKEQYNAAGGWIVFTFGVTPFPYKVVTIASGATGLDLGVFTLASVASRGLIFTVIAALLYVFGAPIRAFIEKRLGLLTFLFVALVIGGFIALKYLV
ncbi:MAG: YqaA family protein [Pseudomonadota bacterium]